MQNETAVDGCTYVNAIMLALCYLMSQINNNNIRQIANTEQETTFQK